MSQVPYRLFIFLLLFPPLAFGARDPWALAVMEVGCVLTAFAFLIGRPRGSGLCEVPGILPLALFLLWLLVQVVPLPAGLVRFVSPATHGLNAGALGGFGAVDWVPLSVAPGATLSEFFRFSSYALFYALTVQLLSDAHRLRRTVLILVFFAAGVALYAIVEVMFSNGKIYGFYPGPPENTHVGPYVYHNHFAGFMELLFPLALASYLHHRPRIRYGSVREALVGVFGDTGGHLHILLGFSAILIAVSVLCSLSRGGILSLGIATLCLMGYWASKGMGAGRHSLVLAAMVLIILTVSGFGWQRVATRFDSTITRDGRIKDGRFVIWKDTIAMLRDFPVTGTGFGTFGKIYPSYRTLVDEKKVGHAHNDYLELAVCGGTVGFALVAWFVAAMLRAVWMSFRRRRDPHARMICLGALTGLLAIFVHSAVDLNFYSHANGLLFFFMCGLAVSASHTRLSGKAGTLLGRWAVPWPGTVPGGLAVFLAGLLLFQGGKFQASRLFGRVEGGALTAGTTPEVRAEMEKALSRAATWDPFSSSYPLILARARAQQGDRTGALRQFDRAIRCCPVDGAVLLLGARTLSRSGDVAIGEGLFQTALLRDRSNPEPLKYYGAWLLGQGRNEEGGRCLQRAMALNQPGDHVRECVGMLLSHGFTKQAIRALVPERVEAMFDYAGVLARLGETDFARRVTIDALHYLGNGEQVKFWYFLRVYNLHMAEKNYGAALATLERSGAFVPDSAARHLLAGEAYMKLGIRYRAAEEYRQALLLQPDNAAAKNRLARL